MSNKDSFKELERWLQEVELYSTKKSIIKMLVANKIDIVTFIYFISKPHKLILVLFILRRKKGKYQMKKAHNLHTRTIASSLKLQPRQARVCSVPLRNLYKEFVLLSSFILFKLFWSNNFMKVPKFQ